MNTLDLIIVIAAIGYGIAGFWNGLLTSVSSIVGMVTGLTLGALIGFAMWVYAQIISYRQTTKPKAVEQINGKAVEVTAPRKSLFDILKGK